MAKNKKNQNMFKLEQQAIFEFSDPDATISKLIIPKELREANWRKCRIVWNNCI